MRTIVVLAVMSVIAAPSVAGGQARGASSAVRAKLVATSLDSCAALPLRRTSGAKAARPDSTRAGVRLDLAERTFAGFSLLMPKGSRYLGFDGTTGARRYSWPSCAHCELRIRMMLDSTHKGIDGEVARLIESQRLIDSTNRDSRTTAREFNEYDRPPAAFTTATGRGYYIERSCGDCAEASLLFGRPGSIADVSLNISDDEPQLVRRQCEMTVVGKTLQWRRNNAAQGMR